MKKIKLMLAALFLTVPAASIALIDVSAFGGYSIPSGSPINTKGFQYGFNAHVNRTFYVVLKAGLGGFYRASNVKVEGADKSRHQLGIDSYGAISIPIFPIEPYFRFRATAWDRVDSTDYFKAYSWGTGVLFVVLTQDFMRLGVYGEYLCDMSKNAGLKAYGHSVSLGVRASFF